MALINIPFLLFLSVATVLPEQSPLSVTPRPHRIHPHGRTQPTPSPSPAVRITVVNATSTPAISLSISGTNLLMSYPYFPQGEWTYNEALKSPDIHCLIRGTNGVIIAEQAIHFRPVSSQFLVLTGDPSHQDTLMNASKIEIPFAPFPQPCVPELQFHVFPYQLGCKDPCHYTIVNGMPGKTLIIRSVAEGLKPSRQLALLTTGNSALLVRQPSSVNYEAEIDGCVFLLPIRQEGAAGNCLIPFFLNQGVPAFIRVFEDP